MTASAPFPSSLRWRDRLCAAACALALVVPVAPARAQQEPATERNGIERNGLPSLGDSSSEDFSVGTERKIGDEILREIRVDPDYIDDPILLEYLQTIWQPLVAQARARGNISSDIDQRFAWEPFLVRDPSVNAFALPGGYVGVHLGLIAMTATRDELASVLAHEMSHVTQRHIARSIGNSKRQSLLSIAGLILGILAASRSGGADGAQAAIAGSQALAVQGQLNFSRDMEREADRVGFAVMSGAGFAPGGMAAMFEKLDQNSRLNDSGGFPYLRSHPLTSERIGEARARLGTAPPVAPVSVLEHTAAQARARVLMDTRVDALRRWQALDTDRNLATAVPDKLLGAYESALASTLLRDWPRADASIAYALGIVRGNPRSDARAERAVALLNVQSLLARGDTAKAASALQPYRSKSMNKDASRPVTLFEAQIALNSPGDAGVMRQEASNLQTWVALYPNDSMAWTLLSQLWQRQAQPLRAIRADAESRYALGDLSGAVERLRAGQRHARESSSVDFIDASVIDSRLRDVEAQRRAIAADEKAGR